MKLSMLMIAFFTLTTLCGQTHKQADAQSGSKPVTHQSTTIQLKYSADFSKTNFAEVCKSIAVEYPEFLKTEIRNGKRQYLKDNKSGYLKIEVKQSGKVRLILKTKNANNPDIAKIKRLENKLSL